MIYYVASLTLEFIFFIFYFSINCFDILPIFEPNVKLSILYITGKQNYKIITVI